MDAFNEHYDNLIYWLAFVFKINNVIYELCEKKQEIEFCEKMKKQKTK